MNWLHFLRTLFRPEGGQTEIRERFHEMLRIGRRMFDEVTAPLFDDAATAPERAAVQAMDADLNRLEREIRRRLLTSVAVNPEQDVTTRLLLLGLAKDAERCGDFAKNIHDVFSRAGKLPPGEHSDLLRDQRAFILRLFDQVWEVYEEGDDERARALLDEAKSFSRRDSEVVQEMLAEPEIPHPVAVALLSRFFKRIQHHLVNVIRAVTLPEELVNDAPDESAKRP